MCFAKNLYRTELAHPDCSLENFSNDRDSILLFLLYMNLNTMSSETSKHVSLLAVLFIKNIIDSNKPYVSDTYYNDIKSNSPLEQKYAELGSYTVSVVEYKFDNKSIPKISAWYPNRT